MLSTEYKYNDFSISGNAQFYFKRDDVRRW